MIGLWYYLGFFVQFEFFCLFGVLFLLLLCCCLVGFGLFGFFLHL